MKKLVLAAVLSSLFSLPAHASFYTGQQLFEDLASFDRVIRLQAEWYLVGIADAAQAVGHVCMPAGIHSSLLSKTIFEHLRGLPAIRSLPVGPVVLHQLSLHFPCPK